MVRVDCVIGILLVVVLFRLSEDKHHQDKQVHKYCESQTLKKCLEIGPQHSIHLLSKKEKPERNFFQTGSVGIMSFEKSFYSSELSSASFLNFS